MSEINVKPSTHQSSVPVRTNLVNGQYVPVYSAGFGADGSLTLVDQVNRFPVEDFLIEVNKGNVPGHDLVHKFGWTDQITTARHHIWNDPTSGGSNLVWQQTAAQYDVYSSDGNDTSAGTGARTVTLECLDANFNTVFETVTLTGTAPVTTTEGPYIRCQRAYVDTVGTYSGTNIGNIDIEVTSGGAKTGDLQAYIEAVEGQTQKSQYTVPAGKTAYILRVSLTIEANKTFSARLNKRADADIVTGSMAPALLKHQWDGLIGPVGEDFKANHIFTGKSDIWYEAVGTAGGGTIEVDYDLLLVDNQ